MEVGLWSYNYSDELYHYGVKGMKWGVRKKQIKSGIRNAQIKTANRSNMVRLNL